jgi:anti-sigma B factor antagonist
MINRLTWAPWIRMSRAAKISRTHATPSPSGTYRFFPYYPATRRTHLPRIGRVRYNGAVTDARSSLAVDDVQQATPGATVLALAGELDLATIGVLKDAVGDRLTPDAHIVLDLAGLTFCDSTGLGAFVALHRQARTSGARFAVAAPRRRIADLFTLSGIDQVIVVYDSTDSALAAPTDGDGTPGPTDDEPA